MYLCGRPQWWRRRQRERYLSVLLSPDFSSRRWYLEARIRDRRCTAGFGIQPLTGHKNVRVLDRETLTSRTIRPLRVDHVISRKWKRGAMPARCAHIIITDCSFHFIPRVRPRPYHQLPDICMSTSCAWNRVPNTHNRSGLANCRRRERIYKRMCLLQEISLQFAYIWYFRTYVFTRVFEFFKCNQLYFILTLM